MYSRKIISYLAKWKEKSSRKPLVIRGCRQVGKTSAVLLFGEKYFQNTIYINLENVEHLRLFRQNLSLTDFEKIINIVFHQNIFSDKTLIFIDEIQNSPALISLLRFFYEQRPDLHVIAAGSLLEAKLQKDGFSFPVGRVEFAYMYPLDFFEYLEAKGEKELLGYLKTVSLQAVIPEALHQQALKIFHEYVMIGGMPEIVKRYVESPDIDELKQLYSSLLTTYAEDVYKYSSAANAKYLHYVLEQVPVFAGNKITYEKFAGSHYHSREMSSAFDILEKIMVLYQIAATRSAELPLVGQTKRPKKLLFLDAGLINHLMGIQGEFVNLKDLNDFYRGRLAEQIVGQNIIAQYQESFPSLFYWAKEKSEGSAEIDFCLSHKGIILGVEVKSGERKKLKSIASFFDAVPKGKMVRVYSGAFGSDSIQAADALREILSLPFYLVPRILEF